MNAKTISAINKYYNNLDGKCYLYNEAGEQIAVFEGVIQEKQSSLYVIQNGGLYCIVLNEDGKYRLEKY